MNWKNNINIKNIAIYGKFEMSLNVLNILY